MNATYCFGIFYIIINAPKIIIVLHQDFLGFRVFILKGENYTAIIFVNNYPVTLNIGKKVKRRFVAVNDIRTNYTFPMLKNCFKIFFIDYFLVAKIQNQLRV